MFDLLALSWKHYAFSIPLALLSIFLMLVILVQRGRGGGLTGALGGMGGQSAFGTKAGDLFTRVTIAVAAIWILLCMLTLKVLNNPTPAAPPPPPVKVSATDKPTTAAPDANKTVPPADAQTGDSKTGQPKVDGATAPAPPASTPAPTSPAPTSPAPTTSAPTSPAPASPPAADGATKTNP